MSTRRTSYAKQRKEWTPSLLRLWMTPPYSMSCEELMACCAEWIEGRSHWNEHNLARWQQTDRGSACKTRQLLSCRARYSEGRMPRRQASLSRLAGGPLEVVESVRPVLESFTQKIIVVGQDPGAAASTKLASNFFAASLWEVIAQVFSFAEKRGVLDPMASLLKMLLPMDEYINRILDRGQRNRGLRWTPA